MTELDQDDLDEKAASEERQREEEELKAEKERQAVLDNIYVLVAVVIIVGGAVAIVLAKIHLFKEETVSEFRPLQQQVGSSTERLN